MESFFTPMAGGSNKRVNALGGAFSSVRIGGGTNALRAINEGANVLLAYFITYNSADGIPTIGATSGIPLGAHSAGGNVLIIIKPRSHDSVLFISSSATIAVVVMFQAGEV